MSRIIETRRLTPVTKYFRIDAPLIAASARPGQFVMLRVREGGERIPITIADYDRGAGTITIVVQEVGATTQRVCALEVGDEILDVAGPLGGHIDIAPGGHVCGVGGGFGAAALLCLMRAVNSRIRQSSAADPKPPPTPQTWPPGGMSMCPPSGPATSRISSPALSAHTRMVVAPTSCTTIVIVPASRS